MFDKLFDIENRFIFLEESLSQPGLSGAEMMQITKERSKLEPIVNAYRTYKTFERDLEAAQEMISSSDPDEKQMGLDEMNSIQKMMDDLKQELVVMMLPQDPNDDKNVILEIRAGTGGDEAALFAGDLARMYQRYADKNGWRVEALSSTPSSSGGFKEAVFMVTGDRVYSSLKFEMGVHRVQRVPVTESQGRVHTSACTVAVLPEAEEVEIEVRAEDLEIKACRASGAGGQHVNTTDSAIRIVHLPTGIAVECQEERSQLKNKEKALKVLKSRLYDKFQQEQADAISADRKSQVGSGDRSERIRTYNFPQGRMTDHRINLTLYKLDEIMQGEIGDILDQLGAHHTAELLKQQSELN